MIGDQDRADHLRLWGGYHYVYVYELGFMIEVWNKVPNTCQSAKLSTKCCSCQFPSDSYLQGSVIYKTGLEYTLEHLVSLRAQREEEDS